MLICFYFHGRFLFTESTVQGFKGTVVSFLEVLLDFFPYCRIHSIISDVLKNEY